MKTPKIAVNREQVEQEDTDLELSEHQQEMMAAEQAELARYTPVVELMAMASPNNHPNVYDVRNWKRKFGKIYVSNILEESDVYVWRPILRQEWKEIVSKGYSDDYLRQEDLLGKCLLFPKVETVLYEKPAGVMPALETKIMFQSGFVSEEFLIRSIREVE